MRQIVRKLRSKDGSSLFLALIFMLICTFVGGAVLAAATANSGRLAEQKQRQQTYLSQRSALQLIAEELKLADDTDNKLAVSSVVTRTVTYVDTGDGGLTPVESYTSSMEANAPAQEMSGLHRVLYEAAIRAYLQNQGVNDAEANDLQTMNFYFGIQRPEVSTMVTADLNAFLPTSGQLTLTLGGSGTEIETITIYYICSIQDEDLCTLTIQFDDPAGTTENGQVKLVLKAHVNTQQRVEIRYSQESGQLVERTANVTNIIWQDPEIQKGGAE